MKIAFFSDIHSNFPALCAAISNAARRKVTKIIFAGDAIGIGPNPVEVIRLLKEKDIQSIQGNVDRKICNLFKKNKDLKKIIKKENKANIAWTAQQLGEEEKNWLMSLPNELSFEIEGIKFHVVHGSPQSDSDYIYPSITSFGLRTKIKDIKMDVLVCGHSHIPFIKVVNNIRVLNCGSVGKPIDGDPKGSYIFVNIQKNGLFNAEIVRFSYKINNLIKDIKDRHVPGISVDEFLKAVKL